jgi:hypothetical protein
MARTGVHIFLGILLWIVFGYYWYIVFQRPITPHTRLALIAVGIIVCVLTLFLVYWIFHNRRIARRFPRRKRRAPASEQPTIDFLGREMMIPGGDELVTAGYIEVRVVDMVDDEGRSQEHKVFRTREELPG